MSSLKYLRRRLKSRLIQLVATCGWLPSKTVKHEDLRHLVEQLRPVAMNDREMIRVGGKGDGGYLIPDDLEGISAMFSPGVSYTCGFDKEMAERGVDVYMADASVPGPPEDHPRFHFQKKFIGSTVVDDFITLDSQAKSTPQWEQEGDFFLQMDIEGHEYITLHSISDELLKRFRIIVIEFHDLEWLCNRRDAFEWMAPAFRKLLKDHDVVHIHPNNANECVHSGDISIPKVMEFTFYRRDRYEKGDVALTFPHALDEDCASNAPPLTLPRCWWGA